jgi:DNA-binding XRE family transcriptional regulator
MSGSDYRPVPIEDVMARFSPERQARIHERARELLLEEATLRELRKARGLTQEKMAETLEIAQENISRLEGRGDVKLSSLAAYVQALGGKLELRATFPDGSSVPLKHASAAITKRPKGSRAVKAIGSAAP